MKKDEFDCYEDYQREAEIYREMGKLRDGKEVRDYMKLNRDDIKRYYIKVPLLCRYPWILYVPSWIMSIAAIIISLVKLLK